MKNIAAPRVVAILATLDTKGEEAVYLSQRVHDLGYEARLVDLSIRPEHRSKPRDKAMTAAGQEAGRKIQGWLAEGVLAGVLGIGGNQGTAAASIAMRDLPLGLPKLLVSTVASHNLRPYIGASDIAIYPSVGDLLGGPNQLTRTTLEQAAGMLAGMIDATRRIDAESKPPAQNLVALTGLGNTQRAVLRSVERLRQAGYEGIPFHACGSGGSAMESLIQAGMFRAVLDLTPHELLGEALGDDIYTPVHPGRLTSAGRAGIPQVIAPGGLDYFVFGPPEAVPAKYRDRPRHCHNPYNTNVRATAEELHRVGETLAQRLNEARGTTAFLYPLRGWSEVGSGAGPLVDPPANEALRVAVRATLRTDQVRYMELDTDINDPTFADEAIRVLLELMAAKSGYAVRG
jgi:uncharacterized protein (UPF0261 family)